jgi:hypothetical protein
MEQILRSLRLILGPCLLAALAFEHADCAPTLGIEHRSNHCEFLATLVASSEWIGVVTGKDLVLEIAIHCDALIGTH